MVNSRAHSFPRAAEFGRCRGISVFSRNFTEFRVNKEIPWQRPNSVSLYCCCNCDTQSLQTAVVKLLWLYLISKHAEYFINAIAHMLYAGPSLEFINYHS